jgi:hypothetical protein
MNDNKKPQIAPWEWDSYWVDFRKQAPMPIDRKVSREELKREARMRTRSRIPADHPDIPF